MEVSLKFDTRAATKAITEKIGRFGGLSKRYSLLADLTDTWFGEDSYVGHFVPAKSGTLVSSGRRVGKDRYVYSAPYAYIQWTGDNVGDGQDHSGNWHRANNWRHEGHTFWADYAARYRWKKFIRDYATPRVAEECREMLKE